MFKLGKERFPQYTYYNVDAKLEEMTQKIRYLKARRGRYEGKRTNKPGG